MLAIIFMLASIVLYSLYPLVGFWASTSIQPFMLVTITHLLSAVIMFVIIYKIVAGNWARITGLLKTSIHDRKTLGLTIFDGFLNGCSHVCLMSSFIFLDKYSAALVYDVWPIPAMILIAILIPGKKRLEIREYIFAALSCCGLIIVLTTHEMDWENIWTTGEELDGLLLGGLLALVAMLTMALSSSVIVMLEQRFSDIAEGKTGDLSTTLTQVPIEQPVSIGDAAIWIGQDNMLGLRSMDKLGTMILPSVLASFSSRCVAFVAIFAVWISFGDVSQSLEIQSAIKVAGIVLFATIIVTFGSIFFIFANRLTTISGINILWNLTSLLGILFLYLAGGKEPIIGQILLGGMLIIASNLAISIQVEFSLSYFASLFFLCVSAVICFFIPGANIENYFDAVAIPAGIFAILVAFMIERYASKQARQEDIAIELYSKSAAHENPEVLVETRAFLKKIFSPLSFVRLEIVAFQYVEYLRANAPDFMTMAVQIAASRLRIFSFGEIFVLWLIGATTIAIGIAGRPTGIVVDLLAVILCGTISFLCLLILDFGNIRRNRFLMRLLDQTQVSGIDELDKLQWRNHNFRFVAGCAAVFSILLFITYAAALWYRV